MHADAASSFGERLLRSVTKQTRKGVARPRTTWYIDAVAQWYLQVLYNDKKDSVAVIVVDEEWVVVAGVAAVVVVVVGVGIDVDVAVHHIGVRS